MISSPLMESTRPARTDKAQGHVHQSYSLLFITCNLPTGRDCFHVRDSISAISFGKVDEVLNILRVLVVDTPVLSYC
jgi:hypothetical protein